jgi:hypothetical protein
MSALVEVEKERSAIENDSERSLFIRPRSPRRRLGGEREHARVRDWKDFTWVTEADPFCQNETPRRTGK